MFLQGKDSMHVAHKNLEYFHGCCWSASLLDGLAQSLDLNTIEKFWYALDSKVHRIPDSPKNKQ